MRVQSSRLVFLTRYRTKFREFLGEAKLPNRHQRQPPRGQGWLAPRREQGGKVLVLKDGPEYITERERGMACGKGRMGHTGGFVRHRLDDVRVERHERRPSAAWGTAPPISGAVLCHSPLPRGTQQVRTRSASIFHYRNSFGSPGE